MHAYVRTSPEMYFNFSKFLEQMFLGIAAPRKGRLLTP
uniref:Uncharacterized protein n=1 Tax=White spot syndrome virus TaxID=342409 RepID=A0A6B9MQD1_9VIRU|nr:hypothetical protein [White spot syndrome virus]WOG35275.1 hypothetical protein [White spot syndrome virus]